MEDRKERNAPWLSVPQFGDWDQKGQVPDYSLDFSKIRENRKQNKRDVSRASLGNEEELIASTTTTTTNTDASTTNSDDQQVQHHHYHQGQHSPTVRFLSSFLLWYIMHYFLCHCLIMLLVPSTTRHVVVGRYKVEEHNTTIHNNYEGGVHVVGCWKKFLSWY